MHPRGVEDLQCLCKNEGGRVSKTLFASYPRGSRVKRAGEAGGGHKRNDHAGAQKRSL